MISYDEYLKEFRLALEDGRLSKEKIEQAWNLAKAEGEKIMESMRFKD